MNEMIQRSMKVGRELRRRLTQHASFGTPCIKMGRSGWFATFDVSAGTIGVNEKLVNESVIQQAYRMGNKEHVRRWIMEMHSIDRAAEKSVACRICVSASVYHRRRRSIDLEVKAIYFKEVPYVTPSFGQDQRRHEVVHRDVMVCDDAVDDVVNRLMERFTETIEALRGSVFCRMTDEAAT